MALNKTTAEKMLYQAYEEALKGARPQTRFVRFIDSIIDNEADTNIEFVGLCTDICVISNAIMAKAYFPEANISVNSNLCAGTSVEAHDNALKAMHQCQINII